jgi:hypothetical protein
MTNIVTPSCQNQKKKKERNKFYSDHGAKKHLSQSRIIERSNPNFYNLNNLHRKIQDRSFTSIRLMPNSKAGHSFCVSMINKIEWREVHTTKMLSMLNSIFIGN